MIDTQFLPLKKRLHDTYFIDPNDLASKRLTAFFKKTTGPLKFFPFKIIIPFSMFVAIGIFAILGLLITRLVSILQFGF